MSVGVPCQQPILGHLRRYFPTLRIRSMKLASGMDLAGVAMLDVPLFARKQC